MKKCFIYAVSLAALIATPAFAATDAVNCVTNRAEELNLRVSPMLVIETATGVAKAAFCEAGVMTGGENVAAVKNPKGNDGLNDAYVAARKAGQNRVASIFTAFAIVGDKE